MAFKKFCGLLQRIFLPIYIHRHFTGYRTELLCKHTQLRLKRYIFFTKKASSSFLFSVSQVIRICRQQASSLITASSSLPSFSHCSSSSFELISLSKRFLK